MTDSCDDNLRSAIESLINNLTTSGEDLSVEDSQAIEKARAAITRITGQLNDMQAKEAAYKAKLAAWSDQFVGGKEVDLGTFQVTNGKVIVTDPCYKRGTWCQGILENVKNGKWLGRAQVKSLEAPFGMDHEVRVFAIEALHESADDTFMELTLAPFEVGVDSAQAGIFSEALYPTETEDVNNIVQDENGHYKRVVTDSPFDYGNPTGFYARACRQTLGGEHTHLEWSEPSFGGAIEEGVVTSSGFGDGGYPCYFHRNAENMVDFIRVIFIDDEEDMDDYNDEEEDEEEF